MEQIDCFGELEEAVIDMLNFKIVPREPGDPGYIEADYVPTETRLYAAEFCRLSKEIDRLTEEREANNRKHKAKLKVAEDKAEESRKRAEVAEKAVKIENEKVKNLTLAVSQEQGQLYNAEKRVRGLQLQLQEMENQCKREREEFGKERTGFVKEGEEFERERGCFVREKEEFTRKQKEIVLQHSSQTEATNKLVQELEKQLEELRNLVAKQQLELNKARGKISGYESTLESLQKEKSNLELKLEQAEDANSEQRLHLDSAQKALDDLKVQVEEKVGQQKVLEEFEKRIKEKDCEIESLKSKRASALLSQSLTPDFSSSVNVPSYRNTVLNKTCNTPTMLKSPRINWEDSAWPSLMISAKNKLTISTPPPSTQSLQDSQDAASDLQTVKQPLQNGTLADNPSRQQTKRQQSLSKLGIQPISLKKSSIGTRSGSHWNIVSTQSDDSSKNPKPFQEEGRWDRSRLSTYDLDEEQSNSNTTPNDNDVDSDVISKDTSPFTIRKSTVEMSHGTPNGSTKARTTGKKRFSPNPSAAPSTRSQKSVPIITRRKHGVDKSRRHLGHFCICRLKLSNSMKLRFHIIKAKAEIRRKKFKCNACEKSFPFFSMLQKHLARKHYDVNFTRGNGIEMGRTRSSHKRLSMLHPKIVHSKTSHEDSTASLPGTNGQSSHELSDNVTTSCNEQIHAKDNRKPENQYFCLCGIELSGKIPLDIHIFNHASESGNGSEGNFLVPSYTAHVWTPNDAVHQPSAGHSSVDHAPSSASAMNKSVRSESSEQGAGASARRFTGRIKGISNHRSSINSKSVKSKEQLAPPQSEDN